MNNRQSSEKHTIFNTQLEQYSLRYLSKSVPTPSGREYIPAFQKRLVLAELFEQLLLFDRVAIKVDCWNNWPLSFLISELGLNRVEELLEYDILQLVLWTPAITAKTGTQLKPGGPIDTSTVFGTPPLVSGYISSPHTDPEYSITIALQRLGYLHPERKKIFIKKASGQYILPNNNFASQSKNIILDAYGQNRLEPFGLPSNKAPEQLDHLERIKLLNLSGDVLETAILAQHNFKSFNNYNYYNLTRQSIEHIESALRVSRNTSAALKIDNVADIRTLVLEKRLPFETVYRLRYKPTVKEYRKWINSISEKTDGDAFTKEYLNEIEGKNRASQSFTGKFIRNLVLFAAGAGLGAVLGTTKEDILLGGLVSQGASYGLGLFDTFVLDGILRGWNPRLFVGELESHINEQNG
jgi:hypothetical protein